MAFTADRIEYDDNPKLAYYWNCPEDWWKRTETIQYETNSIPRVEKLHSRLESEFTERANRWAHDTAIYSSPSAMYLNKDYMVIIAKGLEHPNVIVPLIFKRLSQQGGDWFFALEQIADENPAKDAEDYAGALRAWREWAVNRGYIENSDGVSAA